MQPDHCDLPETNPERRPRFMQQPTSNRRELKRTLSGSIESQRSRRTKVAVKQNSAFQNFFVKMGGLQPNTNALELLSQPRAAQCSDSDDKSDTITTTYKRSVTPYRTAKEKEEYEKQHKSETAEEGKLKERMEIVRLQEICADYKVEVETLRQENRELIDGQAEAINYIKQLENNIRVLQQEIKSPGQYTGQESNKLKKLCNLKKAIRETSKAEVEIDLNKAINEIGRLQKANRNIKIEIDEVRQDLEFKKMIIRNYQHAASLPSAREQILSREISDLKGDIIRIQNEFQRKFEQESRNTKAIIMRLQNQVSKLSIKLHCKDQKAHKELQQLRKVKDFQLATTRQRFHKFLSDYDKFRRIHNTLKAQLATLKHGSRSSRFFAVQQPQTFSLELSPE